MQKEQVKGIWHAIGAYGLWGLLPVYWKFLQQVAAPQLLCHRIVWSFVSLLAVIVLTRKWYAFRLAMASRKVLRAYSVAAVLISINWFTYIWAVNAGFIVETSLGYFINPLLSVLLGVIFFRERLRPWQWVSIALAGAGVVYLTVAYGSLPWIALVLASTFAVYGMAKKAAPLGSLYGLTLETGVLLVPAVLFLIYSDHAGHGAFLRAGLATDAMLLGAGVITAVPLLLFSSAARRIPLSLVGILQYIAPTLQLILGVFLYREPFSAVQLVGFGMVWVALIIYGVEGLLVYRSQTFPVVSE